MNALFRLTCGLAVVVAATVATGCATVRPWQRGRLASECMQFAPDPAMAAFAGHWQESREGASGGAGLQGGGCGCK